MDISTFAIRLIFLFLPGVISSTIYGQLRGKGKRKDFEDYLVIAVFSIVNYGLTGLFLYLLSHFGVKVEPFKAIRAIYDSNVAIDFNVGLEIALASLAGLGTAFIASYIDENKHINRLGRRLKATSRFGDEDVWDYINRSPDIRWVYVRDHKLKLYYYGWIQVFSDPYKERELLLRQVDVYDNDTGQLLYKTDVMYLCRKKEDLTIEAESASNRIVAQGENSAPAEKSALSGERTKLLDEGRQGRESIVQTRISRRVQREPAPVDAEASGDTSPTEAGDAEPSERS